MRRRAGRYAGLALVALVSAVVVGLLAPAAAYAAVSTPAPKRPHPHRKPWPVTLTIQTMPVLVGVLFDFDGQKVRTDKTGKVRITQEHNFGKHTLTLVDKTVTGSTRRFSFVRWAGQRDPDQAFRPEVTGLPMRAPYTVTAAFAVQYPVKPSFLGTGGGLVDTDRIDEVSVRAATGEIVRLDPDAITWLAGQSPVYKSGDVTMSTAQFSLQRVMVDGANVVDVGQQTFRPAQGRPVAFTTKFFDLTVKAHDALFKNATGEKATVTYPNGVVRSVDLSAGHSATLTDLPRGVYVVKLVGAGTSLPSQVTLSRTTSTDLVVATRKDLVTIALVALVLAAGLLMLGRGRRHVRSAVVAVRLQRSGQRPGPSRHSEPTSTDASTDASSNDSSDASTDDSSDAGTATGAERIDLSTSSSSEPREPHETDVPV
jgi:hypothetical protein